MGVYFVLMRAGSVTFHGLEAIMAPATRKPTSRRRAAALKFLSGISFETSASRREITHDYTLVVEEKHRFTIQKSFAEDASEVNLFSSSVCVDAECFKSSSVASSCKDRLVRSKSELRF